MKLLEIRGPHTFGKWKVTQIVEFEGEAFPHSFLFPDLSADEIRAASPAGEQARITESGMIITSTQLFVLQGDDHVVLIEQGTGNGKTRPNEPYWDHQNLPYRETLAALGIGPEDVDYVFFSHLHPDHVGLATTWNNDRWEPTFPRAAYVLSKREWDYWNGINPEDPQSLPFIDDSVRPLVNAGCIRYARDGERVAGIRIHEVPGHTPGFLLFEAVGCGLWFIGDLLHHPSQAVHPEWVSGSFDVDPTKNQTQRRRYFKIFADTGATLLGAHMGNLFRITETQPGCYAVQYEAKP